MPRFAANITTMFNELPVAERFDAARAAGFTAIEYLNPYGHSITQTRQWLTDAGLDLILINTPLGDAAAGERGLGALPGREADFQEQFAHTLEYAVELGVPQIHTMAGVVPQPDMQTKCEATLLDNLTSAAAQAAPHGINLLLEPLNAVDTPGYVYSYLADTQRLVDQLRQRDIHNVFIQFDFYHVQVMEGNLGARLREHWESINHIQFSSLPGRHEPQHGEVNMPFLFEQVDQLSYSGWIGCEYKAKTTTLEGLTWAQPYGIG